MRQHNKKVRFKCQIIALAFLLVASAMPAKTMAETSGNVQNDAFQVSSGVNYNDIRLTDGKGHNSVRVLEMDLDDPYTKVELGFPSALDALGRTTSQALTYQKPGHMVVGAVNGSFFSLEERCILYQKIIN